MRQAEIDCLDTVVVLLGQTAHMRTAHRMAGLQAQRRLDMLHKCSEQIQKSAIGITYLLRNIGIHQRAEYQRRRVLLQRAFIDTQSRYSRFFRSEEQTSAHTAL